MRLTVLIIITVILVSCGLCIMSLTEIQLANAERDNRTLTITGELPAVRGSITDSTGKLIAGSRDSYEIIIDAAYFPKLNSDINSVLLQVIDFLEKSNCNYKRAFSHAEPILPELVSKYEIELDLDREKIVSIAAVRYQMELEGFSVGNPFVIAEDISPVIAAAIMEQSVRLPGVGIAKSAVRYIESGDVLPHIIGTVGPIYAEEYDELKARGYSADAVLGKSGIEKAAEEFLRGEAGLRQIIYRRGEALDDETISSPKSGATVSLTVESSFQLEIQNQLESYLEKCGSSCGAVAILDCQTGAVLALATAPTYNLTDYIEDYSLIASGENSPLLNRALYGIYRPGSSFKTVTAVAGLSEGIITPESTYYCGHDYNCYGTKMGCLGTHRNISCINALRVSCNIYFYRLALDLGEDKLAEYARGLGMGTDIGFDIGSSNGYLAIPETLERFGLNWSEGQLAQAGIGQSETGVTPLQMAVSAMTIANEGYRLRPYIIGSVTDSSGNRVYEAKREVLSHIGTEEAYQTVLEGMIAAADNFYHGAATLKGSGLKAAVKTGTPQSGRGTDSVVMGFAPHDSPKVAFAIVLEGGENARYMVRNLLEICKEKGYLYE